MRWIFITLKLEVVVPLSILLFFTGGDRSRECGGTSTSQLCGDESGSHSQVHEAHLPSSHSDGLMDSHDPEPLQDAAERGLCSWDRHPFMQALGAQRQTDTLLSVKVIPGGFRGSVAQVHTVHGVSQVLCASTCTIVQCPDIQFSHLHSYNWGLYKEPGLSCPSYYISLQKSDLRIT